MKRITEIQEKRQKHFIKNRYICQSVRTTKLTYTDVLPVCTVTEILKSILFYIRLKASKKIAEEADRKEVQTNINLIKPKPGKELFLCRDIANSIPSVAGVSLIVKYTQIYRVPTKLKKLGGISIYWEHSCHWVMTKWH